MTFTPEQKSKLESIAKAMLLGVDILDAAGVPAGDADRHLAEGYAAIMTLLYPDGIPADPMDQRCPCGQPAHHVLVN